MFPVIFCVRSLVVRFYVIIFFYWIPTTQLRPSVESPPTSQVTINGRPPRKRTRTRGSRTSRVGPEALCTRTSESVVFFGDGDGVILVSVLRAISVRLRENGNGAQRLAIIPYGERTILYGWAFIFVDGENLEIENIRKFIFHLPFCFHCSTLDPQHYNDYKIRTAIKSFFFFFLIVYK